MVDATLNLDDRSYADLLGEARSLISSVVPEWTNHNPTDPGVVLIELFAWLTEMLLYRTNQVPRANYEVFLRLLNGEDLPVGLDTAIRETVLGLRRRYRAITAEDYESLSIHDWPGTDDARELGGIARARCVPARDLTLTDADERAQIRPEQVSLVIVPDRPGEAAPMPDPALCEALWTWLDARRLLTVRHHVVGPDYVPVTIRAKLYLQAGALESEVRERADQALRDFLHPLIGGAEGTGWPFGQHLYVSEVYQCLDRVPGIDYVRDVGLETSDRAREMLYDGEVKGLMLHPHELVTVEALALGYDRS